MLNLFENFFDLFKYLFNELKPRKKIKVFSHVCTEQFGPRNRSKEKGTIKIIKLLTTAMQRSLSALSVRVVQAFNYLKQKDVMPANIHETSQFRFLKF